MKLYLFFLILNLFIFLALSDSLKHGKSKASDKNEHKLQNSHKEKILPKFFKLFQSNWGGDPKEKKSATVISNQLKGLEKHRRNQWRKRVYALGMHKKGKRTRQFGSSFSNDQYPLKYWKN